MIEAREDAAKQRKDTVKHRRAQVETTLGRLIWDEYEQDEAEALEGVLSERLDAEELAGSFLEEPLDAQIERIRLSIGLVAVEPDPAEEAPPAPPQDSLSDDDYWRSSA